MSDIPIFVASPLHDPLCVDVPFDGTVEDLINAYAAKTGNTPTALLHQGERLEPTSSLADVGLCPETTVEVETGLVWNLVAMGNKPETEFLDEDKMGFSESLSHEGSQFRGSEILDNTHTWEFECLCQEDYYLYFVLMNPPEEGKPWPLTGGSFFTFASKLHGWDSTGRQFSTGGDGKRESASNVWGPHGNGTVSRLRFELDARSGTFTCERRINKTRLKLPEREDATEWVVEGDISDWSEPTKVTMELPKDMKWCPVWVTGSKGPRVRLTRVESRANPRGMFEILSE